VDVRESDSEVEVTAELPGMDEADIDVSVADGVLTIRGERKVEHETTERGYLRRERSFGVIERVVPLPPGLDPNSATANFKNGVLTVTIAKTPEARDTVKRIAVRRG
jgi:HSP20 family protein